MTLKDMIDALRTEENIIDVRDRDNHRIGTFYQSSKGIRMYLNKEVIQWFPGAFPVGSALFTVLINDE